MEACNEHYVDVEEIPNDDDEFFIVTNQPEKKKMKKTSVVNVATAPVTHIANNINAPPLRE